MPVRGVRSIWPSKGRPPTGIFSSRGSQKKDSTADMPNQSVKNYAEGSGTRSKPSNPGSPNLRHQPHKRIW